MKTPKRQFPEMPTCPICGGKVETEWVSEDYSFGQMAVFCKEDDHLYCGEGGLTKTAYEELIKRCQRADAVYDTLLIDKGEYAIRARWKRKNRETQLKRTIARLKQELAESERDRKHISRDHISRYAQLAAYNMTLKNIMRGAEQNLQGLWMESMFGQNIEGS